MFASETSRVVPPPAQRVARQVWRNGFALLGERTLAEEVPVAFSYDGATHAVLMATPKDLEDFALGFSYTEGIITAPAEIAELVVVGVVDGIVLRIWLTLDGTMRSTNWQARCSAEAGQLPKASLCCRAGFPSSSCKKRA